MKYDAEKIRYDLIPPEVLQELAKVLTYGAKKYPENSWKNVEPFNQRYYAALERHLQAWRLGEATDAETGYSHLTHALACLSFLVYKETQHASLERPTEQSD